METEEREISVLVAESRNFAFLGLRSMVTGAQGISVDRRAVSVDELRRSLGEDPADIVLVGHLYGCEDSALAVDAEVNRMEVRSRIVALVDPGAVEAASKTAGGVAYLPTDIGTEDFRAAIRVLSAGYALSLRGNVECIPVKSGYRGGEDVAQPRVWDGITHRELDVLSLLARGYSNARISRSLSISENTVKSHVRSILGKLGIHNRASAVAYAYEHNII